MIGSRSFHVASVTATAPDSAHSAMPLERRAVFFSLDEARYAQQTHGEVNGLSMLTTRTRKTDTGLR